MGSKWQIANGGKEMNFTKMGLAVLLGVAIGMFVMTVIRPEPVKAAGGNVLIQHLRFSRFASPSIKSQGAMVGFSCIGEPRENEFVDCYIVSR